MFIDILFGIHKKDIYVSCGLELKKKKKNFI